MDEQSLDDFSYEVAERLFAQFPEWRALARIDGVQNGIGYLRLAVDAPVEASAAFGLSVITQDREVTVGFDHYHGHFFGQVGDGERFGTDYAIHFVSQLVAERVAVISWWRAAHLVAFSTIEHGKPVMPNDLVGSHDHVRIRSWKGALNAERNA